MKDSLKKCTYDILAVIEVVLVMKICNNLKTKSLQTSIDLLITILDKNNEVKVCSLECKSRLTHSTQQYDISQLMLGSGTYSKVKWDIEHLSYYTLSFHEKIQILHHTVACDLDIILLLVGK